MREDPYSIVSGHIRGAIRDSKLLRHTRVRRGPSLAKQDIAGEPELPQEFSEEPPALSGGAQFHDELALKAVAGKGRAFGRRDLLAVFFQGFPDLLRRVTTDG